MILNRMGWLSGLAAVVSVMVLSVMCLMSGCEKAPVNRDIEGHWQLLRFTLVETGEVVECEHLYFGISYMVTMVAEKGGSNGYGAYMARTELKEDGSALVLRDFKLRGATSDTKVDATVEQLLPFGIDNPKETVFRVVESSHKNMVLESDYARVVLRRF